MTITRVYYDYKQHLKGRFSLYGKEALEISTPIKQFLLSTTLEVKGNNQYV